MEWFTKLDRASNRTSVERAGVWLLERSAAPKVLVIQVRTNIRKEQTPPVL